MNVGLHLAAFAAPGADTRVRVRELEEQVAVAEELGYSMVSAGHHYLTQSAFLQPQSLLAYLAGRTSRIRIGFGVLLAPLLPPVALAEELATLDVVSGGRLTVGLGAGYRRAEFAAVGVPMDERYRRLEEGIRLMRRLWDGETVTEDGLFGSIDRARLHLAPVQAGGPPIWLGAVGERGLRRVADLDVSWVANVGDSEATLAEHLGILRFELTVRRLPLERPYPVIRDAAVAETTAEALARAHRHADFRPGRAGADAEPESEESLVARALIGTPDEILRRLRGWHDRLGVTDVVLRMDWGGMAHPEILAAIRLAGRAVVPEAASWSRAPD